jgi:pimeloyl-ACP methyl ester carboxylesterase
MKPIVFGGRFGWLHEGRGERGVILCNTLGHEAVWTRNGTRYLAEALAARGIWALRFDYAGTGDSAGGNDSADAFDSAVSDVETASAWLKETTGVTHVTLCGLRVGAALALSAALKEPVDDLVLLAPMLSGRTYMRELTMVRKTWLDQLAPPLRAAQPEDGPLNVLGQVYQDDLKLALETFDAAAIARNASRSPAMRVLIAHTRVSACEALRSALTAHGASVEMNSFDDFGAFAQETALSQHPAATFARAIEWMSEGRSIDAAAMPDESAWPDDLLIQTPESIERPVLIGEHRLFGILCEPRSVTARKSALLIANTSASAHVGDSQLSVRMARELARRGIASLRYDARGRGDSPREEGTPHAGTPFSNIYEPCATEDTASAARWLASKGFSNIVSFGICSGAYHAMRAAIVEPALNGVVMINIPTFTKPVPQPVNGAKNQARNSMAGYAISMFDPSKWKRVVSGERKLGPVVRYIAGYLLTRLRLRVADALGVSRRALTAGEIPASPAAMLDALDRKGVRTLLVHGAYDGSLDLLAMHFGKHGQRLSRYPNVRVAIIDDIDHALFNASSSAKVIALCDTLIKQMCTREDDARIPAGTPAIS